MKTGAELIAVAALLCAGCGSTYHPEYHPESVYTENISIGDHITNNTGADMASGVVTSTNVTFPAKDPSKVVILQSTHLEKTAEVVGVIDAHAAMGKQEEALAILRKKAAAMGADAVVGVEFHHGEGEGEPTHLSGLAVKFVDRSY